MKVAHTPARARAAAVARSRSAASTASIAGIAPCSKRPGDGPRARRSITFDPHPRIALGNKVELLTTLERRLELLEEAGVETALVAAFTPELQQLAPEVFAERYLRAIGAELVVAGEDFRFGVRRSGDLALLERLGFDVVVAARGRGRVVDRDPSGARRGRRRRRGRDARQARSSSTESSSPDTSAAGRSDTRPRTSCSSPTSRARGTGSTRASARGHRAAVSIGTNPHYGGTERRIEPYLLEFEGDLYGQRLVVELWERLRDEAVFESEEALVEQIARDVEATRRARRPAGRGR